MSLLTSSRPELQTYATLLRSVRQTITKGKERAADAVELELRRTKWEVGHLILEHILLNKERANYGEQVLKKLSADLLTSDREIRYMVEFARTYPIWPHASKLSWGDTRELLSINDTEKRKELMERAQQEKWSRQTLRREIGKLRAEKQIVVSGNSEAPLMAKKGSLYTYQVVIAKLGQWKSKPVVDLGFSNYFRPHGKFPFRETDRVISKLTREGYSLQRSKAVAEELFTYRVEVDEVTDGDTLWVLIDLGFGFTTKQCLRLRGLDCPEMATRDGQAAKKFVERQVRFAKEVVITSTKSDKYDRYLADVWIGETYLNQKLIDEGLAMRIPE